MSSRPEQMRDRTKAFALRVIRCSGRYLIKTDTQVLGKQLLRCGTSVAANYRAICRARSKAEFIARLGIVAEEELLIESGILKTAMTDGPLKEARELAAILTASRETARKAA